MLQMFEPDWIETAKDPPFYTKIVTCKQQQCCLCNVSVTYYNSLCGAPAFLFFCTCGGKPKPTNQTEGLLEGRQGYMITPTPSNLYLACKILLTWGGVSWLTWKRGEGLFLAQLMGYNHNVHLQLSKLTWSSLSLTWSFLINFSRQTYCKPFRK